MNALQFGRLRVVLLALSLLTLASSAFAQTADNSLTLVPLPGGTFTMGEAETAYLGPPGSYDAPLHEVTLSPFQMSDTEITNQQYVEFLNAALADGLVEVLDAPTPPDLGNTLVYGTQSAPEEYRGLALLNLSGTRVMKDHADDSDNNEFTGVIEPENPLNIAYIGYDESRAVGDWFYVKDPRDSADFDWQALTTYYNYTSIPLELDTSVELNDYDDWEELADFPNNMPTVADVRNWPATFIRWYGAKAFAMYYSYDLPTEAEWEYAAQGGDSFIYATDDGQVDGDGTSANWNHLEANPSRGHVADVKTGEPNPYGLYNLAGNVWEWMDDWYAADFYADATDPANTANSGLKVRRGGAWNYHRSTLKSAARAEDEQFKGNDHFGFRVVDRTVETATEADLAITIDFSGAIQDGGFEVTNNGPSTAESVVVNFAARFIEGDDGDGNVVMRASPLPSAGSYDLDPGYWTSESSFPGQEVYIEGVWIIDQLAAGATATLSYFQLGSSTALNITASVTHDEVDPDTSNNEAAYSFGSFEVVELMADLTTMMVLLDAESFSPIDVLDFNTGALLQIDVLNSGPDAARNVAVTTTLPPGLSLVEGSSNMTHGSFDEDTGVWAIADFPSGEAATMSSSVIGSVPGTYEASAAATSDVTDPNSADNSASYSFTVGEAADLYLEAAWMEEAILIDTDIVRQYHVGDDWSTEATLSMSVTNTRDFAATDVRVDGNLPLGLVVVPGSWDIYSSPEGYGGVFDEDSSVWSIGSLPGGTSVSLDFRVTGDSLGSHEFTASLTETGTDPVPENNAASAVLSVVEPEADLSVNIHFWSLDSPQDLVTIPVSEQMVVVVDFWNDGDFDATGVVVGTTLPDGYGIVEGSGGFYPTGGHFDEATGLFTTTDPVSKEDAYTLTFEVEHTALGEHEFSATISANETDPSPSGNDSSASITVTEPEWSVSPPSFAASMRVTGIVLFDGVDLTDSADQLAAFVDGEVRGVASPVLMGGETLFGLVIYGDTLETSSISFQAYDASAASVMTLVDEFSFEAGSTVGNPFDPYVFGAVVYDGPPGWTVDSSGFPASMEVEGMAFADGISFSLGDTLAAFVDAEVRGVAPAVDTSGQIVFPMTIHGAPGDNPISFKIYDSDADHVSDLTEEVNFEGGAVWGSTTEPFDWNVGALTAPPTWEQDLANLDTSGLSRMTIIAALYIEGFRDGHPANLMKASVNGIFGGFATASFVDGRAVYTLDVYGEAGGEVTFGAFAFDPTDGVQKQFILEKVDQLEPGAPVGSVAKPVAMDTRKLTERPALWNGFDPPTDHTATMTIDGSLTIESMYLGETLLEDLVAVHPDDFVAVYIGDDLRGVASPEVVGDSYSFPLMVYSDVGDASTLTFKAFFAAANEVIDLSEEVIFSEGASLGVPGQVFWQGGAIGVEFAVDSEGTEGTMNVTGEVVVENPAGKTGDDPALAPGDQVLAYVGEQVRGIAELQAGTGDALVFDIQVAGDSGDPVYFKTYAKDSNTLLVVDEVVPFRPGTRLGDSANRQRLTASNALQIDLRVHLEGASQGGELMSTHLADQRLITLEQPFKDSTYVGTNLFHPGAELLISVPENAVDWVLVEIRTDTDPSTKVAVRAGILLSDGRVIHPDGASPVRLLELPPGEYYTVVKHRNHLPVLSAVPIRLGTQPVRYDFTKAGSQADGVGAQAWISTGLYGLHAGDGNVSGSVSPGDLDIWQASNGTAGYFIADFDLSGGVTAADYALWLGNLGLRTQVGGR